MKISLNPKPHLEKHRLPLVWVLPCQQCSMGNEEWVGVWPDDLSTTRSGPNQHLPALSSSSIDRPHFHIHRRKLQDVCELGEVERKLHRRWLLCFLNTQQFTHLLGLLSVLHGNFMRERTWAYGLSVYILFDLMVNMVDGVWKAHFYILILQYFIFHLTRVTVEFSLNIQQLILRSMLPTHQPNEITLEITASYNNPVLYDCQVWLHSELQQHLKRKVTTCIIKGAIT